MRMQDFEVARILGNIEGRLGGIESGIQELRDVQKCQSKDCENCRKEINEEIDQKANLDEFLGVKKRLTDVEKKHTGEDAVAGYLSNKYVQIGILIGTMSGLVSLVIYVRGLF